MTRRNDKAERQKRALQATTIELFEIGKERGLGPRQVITLFHSLVELDWVPRDVDPLKALERLTEEPEETYKDGEDGSPRHRGGREGDSEAPGDDPGGER